MAGVDSESVDATRRTRLANERTYLAWVRTALTALAVALGAGKIVPGVADVTSWPFEVLGAGFAVLALVLVGLGVNRFLRVERALEEGHFAPFQPREAILVAAIATVIGIATFVLVFVR